MINRNKKGVSPVIATTIIITLTLIVGFATWSFVNSEAAAASSAFGESTASNVNYLREKFVITNAAFNYPNNGKITIWLYNNGAVNTQIKEIFIGTSTTSMIKVSSFTSNPSILEVGKSCCIVFDYSTNSGNTYYIKAVGQFGNIALYYQKA
ncbi:MAG: hypothetical protein QXD42_06765 [Nitrososphaerales archaeon]